MGFSRQNYWSALPLPSLIALTRWTFVGKVMSLLLNILSRLVITFLPRGKQAPFNFMAAITICRDFGAPQNSQPLLPLFPLFHYLFAMKRWGQMP